MAQTAAAGLLGRQLKRMQSDKDIPGISCGLVENNVLEWEVMLMISDDCRFYGGKKCKTPPFEKGGNLGAETEKSHKIGGFFRAHLTFPPEYPLLPPKMTFKSPIFHPNGISSPPQPKTPQLTPQPSLPLRRSLHLDPAPPRRRQIRLRSSLRAVVTGPDARNDPTERDQHAEQPERREPRERRGGEVVEGGYEGVSAEV